MQPIDYERIWRKKWGDMQRYGPIHRHHRRLMGKLLHGVEVGSVLDVGCGEGSNLIYIHNLFPNLQVYGFDISMEALQHARSVLPDANFAMGDIQSQIPPFDADLIMCLDVLEHLPNDVQALRNISRVTKKYLLISTVQGRMRDFEGDIGHVRNYQHGELARKITDCGFEIISKTEWGFPFYSPLYRSLLNMQVSQQATFGVYGAGKKILCNVLYCLFMLNFSRRGDVIFVLARPKVS